jgi:hypothetical protein
MARRKTRVNALLALRSIRGTQTRLGIPDRSTRSGCKPIHSPGERKRRWPIDLTVGLF